MTRKGFRYTPFTTTMILAASVGIMGCSSNDENERTAAPQSGIITENGTADNDRNLGSPQQGPIEPGEAKGLPEPGEAKDGNPCPPNKEVSACATTCTCRTYSYANNVSTEQDSMSFGANVYICLDPGEHSFGGTVNFECQKLCRTKMTPPAGGFVSGTAQKSNCLGIGWAK